MIPIRDDAPRSTVPFINYLIIALNVLVFLFQLSLGRNLQGFTFQFGFVPERLNQFFLGRVAVEAAVVPLFSSMFMHGSPLHLIFNMWALAIFGDNVEDRLGHFPYIIFYLISGLAADGLHFLFNLHSIIPSIGASGAIAGVMGAYFLLYPGARVLTWFFVFVLWLPAWLVLGYWFIVQFLSGAATAIVTTSQTTGGIAVWAHVGGFFAGMLLIKLFPVKRTRYAYYDDY